MNPCRASIGVGSSPSGLYPSHDYFVVCAELRRDRVQYAFQAAARLGQHGIDHATAVGNARLHDRDIPALVAIGFGRLRPAGRAHAVEVFTAADPGDRESVGWGTRVSVSVDLGGRRIIKKKKSQ